jgi:hypothetical protein
VFSLGIVEDDQDIVAIIKESHDYFNNKDTREWVEWAGNILMLKLYTEMEMEKGVVKRAKVEAEHIEHILFGRRNRGENIYGNTSYLTRRTPVPVLRLKVEAFFCVPVACCCLNLNTSAQYPQIQ